MKYHLALYFELSHRTSMKNCLFYFKLLNNLVACRKFEFLIKKCNFMLVYEYIDGNGDRFLSHILTF